jgi:hypothetical protein
MRISPVDHFFNKFLTLPSLKKLLYIAIFTLLLCKAGTSQTNLVSNPSFEDTLRCPYATGLFTGFVKNWWGGNDQYFNDSCDEVDLGVPDNLWGYQYARTGLAMAGMNTILLDSFASTTNVREYIYTILTDTLQAGKQYFVSFYLNASNKAEYACNNFGAYFSKTYLNLNHQVQNVTPQIANIPTRQLTDTANWMLIEGRFTASGGEKYMTLGNFTPDSLCHLTFMRTAPDNLYDWRLAFYYVDDVFVSLDTAGTMGISSYSSIHSDVSIFPNPSKGIISVKYSLPNSNHATFDLLNACGQKISSLGLNLEKNQMELDETTLPNGIYFYQIIADGQRVAGGKMVIQN